MTQVPTNTAASDVPSNAILASDHACFKCGYNLRGLAYAGSCPECGTSVSDSMRGILLQYANPDYLRSVLTGHSWVLNAILLLIVLTILNVVVTFAAPFQGSVLLMTGLGIAVSVWSFLGYLKLTEPDPQFSGTERPDAARKVVRIAAGVSIVANTLAAMVAGATLAGIGGGGMILQLLAGGLSLLGYIAFAVQFFAMMNYTIWLAKRVPDAWIIKRATTYRWLLPVLSTVGVLLVGLGPLIAMVLYWNLLDRMRKHLKAIAATGKPADLPGALG
jgi:hypothetical protein